jgi:hypothetical protein
VFLIERLIEDFLYLKNPKDCLPSKLEPNTQELVSFIFDKDMFKEALASYDISKLFCKKKENFFR